MPTKSDAVQGNCFICGKTAAKTAIKNHVLKYHNGGDEQCYLIKAEGLYNKDYWLFFSVSLDATLSSVDKFLRQIWCECCGHMSAFRSGGGQVGKTRKVSTLAVGDKLMYEYDFGSTTEILLTIVSEISRPKQREKVRLLARNEPLGEICDTCGAPATAFNTWENELVCDECGKKAEDEAALLPIVNSPRQGECGYDGEQDRWTFDPEAAFPQPPSAYASGNRRGVWVLPKKEETSAEANWQKVSKEDQDKILSNAFCGKCGVTTIVNYAFENDSLGVVLNGKCVKCGSKIARFVEDEWYGGK